VTATRMIGVDWGTTRFRAYLIAADGTVCDRRASDRGLLGVAPGAFGCVLQEEVAPWRRAYPDAPVVAAGMVGSRQGWKEVPYVSCPAGLAEIVAGTLEIDAGEVGRVRLVPGLTVRDEAGIPDVMRGEETQIIGAASSLGGGDEVVVLPGTHSKWATVRDGRILAFSTFMTGELFAVLRSHSILGRLMNDSRADNDAFARGVRTGGLEGGAGLLRRLFSARTLGLFDEIPGPSIESYLSGLLIGTEIAEATKTVSPPSAVTLISGATLATAYTRAFELIGITVRRIDDDAAARGLWMIGREVARTARS
jgi:2-dehydro-3-deoxygalactonokinase